MRNAVRARGSSLLPAILAGPTALLAATLAACGGGGSGGGGSSGGSAAGAGSTSASGVTSGTHLAGSSSNHTQWQTALAALAQPAAPLRFEPGALSAWNAAMARAWPRLLPMATQQLVAALHSQASAQPQGGIQILAIRNVQLDLAAPPQLAASAPSALQRVTVGIPGAPARWSVAFTADVGGYVPVNLFGVTSYLSLTAPITVTVSDVSIEVSAEVDLSRLDGIRLVGAGQPAVSFQLHLWSADALVQAAVGPLTQALDPIIRTALLVLEPIARMELAATLHNIPQGPSFGQGGPDLVARPNAPALEPIAIEIADEVTRTHMPHDQVWPALFDAAPYGTGQVLEYRDHGDSAFWTGHFLAGESYRHDLTGDPRALAAATRAVRGIDTLLSVWAPGDGLLARAAIPLSDPWFKDIQGARTLYHGQVGGVAYGALGNVSRDQYIGVMLGLSQAYHRVPALRDTVRPLIGRVLSYLERNEWVVYNADGVTPSTSFATTPTPFYTFARVGAAADPARWQALAQRYAPMASIAWLSAWVSARDVHVSYYKFNLSHALLTMLIELETDVENYRRHLQLLRIEREVIGHHQNAWFDAVYAMAVPTDAPVVGPRVQQMLELWTARPRRGFAVRNSQDPTIAQATVVVTHQDYNTQAGQVQTTVTTKQVAQYPLPIDKRKPTDFLWQRSPFDLDGSHDPRMQETGIDLTLPFWVARSHGLF